MKRLFLAAAVAALWSQAASADIHLSLDSINQLGPNDYVWNYDVWLDAKKSTNSSPLADVALSGDYVTLMNIGKFLSASFTPGGAGAGASFAQGAGLGTDIALEGDQNVSTPYTLGTGVVQSAVPVNTHDHLEWVTVGLASAFPPNYVANNTTQNEMLGVLHIESGTSVQTPQGKVGYFAAETHTFAQWNNTGLLGKVTTAVNARYVPVPVPEPESMSMMALGLVAAGAFAFRRRQLID